MSGVVDGPGEQLPVRGSAREQPGETPATVRAAAEDEAREQLPLLPGFREIALRRMADERRRLMTDLAAERQAARLSQTEVAARMGTSQSAVARLESGAADARASTLERYAAAIGRQITWRMHGSARHAPGEEATDHGAVSR